MPAIIVLILLAIVALTVLSFAVHVLFSPWLLLVAIGILCSWPLASWPGSSSARGTPASSRELLPAETGTRTGRPRAAQAPDINLARAVPRAWPPASSCPPASRWRCPRG
jgi:hypothetical protein